MIYIKSGTQYDIETDANYFIIEASADGKVAKNCSLRLDKAGEPTKAQFLTILRNLIWTIEHEIGE